MHRSLLNICGFFFPFGFSCVKNELLPSHPLELSEKNLQLNQDKMNFSTLRNIQGLFAPLKLQMEFKAVQQVHRLPFLPSSNLSLDILRGNDETIGFEDILNGEWHPALWNTILTIQGDISPLRLSQGHHRSHS